MSTDNNNYYKITPFDGAPENWDEFKFAFLNCLEMAGDSMVDYVTTAVEEPSKSAEKVTHKKMVSKSYAFVCVNCGPAALTHIRTVERNGYVAWKTLLGFYEKKSVSNIIKMKMTLFGMKMHEDEKSYVFGHRIQAVVDRLKVLAVDTPDADVCAILLAGLDSRYDALVTAMDLETGLTSVSLLDKLRTFEDRRDRSGVDSSTMALAATSNRGKKNKQYAAYLKKLVCLTCGGKGHKAKDCPTGKTFEANMAGVTADFEYMEHDGGHPHQPDYDY